MLNDIITKVNEIFAEKNLPFSLNIDDYDAVFVKQISMTEILRRGQRENQNGVSNNNLFSRVDPTRQNSNAATHYFIPSATSQILPPFLDNGPNELKYIFTLPFNIPHSVLHLMLDEIPLGYYTTSKIDLLKTSYPLAESSEVELSARKSTGNRIMFANKDYIKEPIQKLFFMELKYLLFEYDYMIFLKYKKSHKYQILFIPSQIGTSKNLNAYNNLLFNLSTTTLVPSTHLQQVGGKNLIVFGAPGTGKSHWIKNQYERNSEILRVTFHPEYSYNEFIGSLRPVNDSLTGFSYNFVPGPFTKILNLALSNPSKNYTLIIEEINRANTAAVFGDVFQILDRNVDGISDYGIENEEILNYLSINQNYFTEVKLPPNLSLVATMNSADQGVYQMDTAFKRRWNVKYIPIEFDSWHDNVSIQYFDKKISVRNFIETTNKFLSNNGDLQINEDRLIGPYFLREEEANSWFTEGYYKKILLYLWDDIARINRNYVFDDKYRQFSHLCSAFESGDAVFVDALHEELLIYLEDIYPIIETDQNLILAAEADNDTYNAQSSIPEPEALDNLGLSENNDEEN